jgi:6-phosphogluconolactonase
MTFSQYWLYVSGYAAADRPGIHAFTFDAASGSLTAGWSFPGIANPSFIRVHPNGRWLYAASETSQQTDGIPGSVWSLHFTSPTGSPRLLNQRASGGDWPCHLEIDVTGRWLLVSNYGTGTVGVLPILADGTLGEMTDLVKHYGSGLRPERQEGPHAHSATFTPDNRFAIVADLGIDQLVLYAFDPSSGQLHTHTHTDTRPGAGPRHMAFHPDSQYLYVANELDNTVAVYNYDTARSSLTERQIIETLPPDAPENTVADIHLSPTGDRLYVSNRGHDSLAVFAIAADGQLERLAIESCGGRWPRNFAIAPGGHFLLVANQYSDEVTVLPVQDGTKIPGDPFVRVTIPGASCVQFAPAEA